MKQEVKTFEDLSSEYSIWLLKYCSSHFDSPLFVVWYTDTEEDSTDRFLTFKSGKIFAVKSLKDLKRILIDSIDHLDVPDNLASWLYGFNSFEVNEYSTYDLTSVEDAVSKNDLSISTIESLVSFISLFLDFINQDEKNSHLEVYTDKELLKETWDYFYKYIFWPRFNDREKFEKWDRPQLDIDAKELLLQLKDVRTVFDENIKVLHYDK